jgi:hypothetical protein
MYGTMRKVVVLALVLGAGLAGKGAAQSLPLTVPEGAPLRVYLTERTPKKLGQPVHAKLLESVFSFDREVIPAGTEVNGVVTRLVPVPKMQRIAAVLGGDFTPLHQAEIQFTEFTLPSGVRLPLNTVESVGLASIYDPPKPKKAKKGEAKAGASPKAPSDGGLVNQGKVAMQGQINSQINARTRGVVDIIRAPNKKEKLEDYLWSRVPYHPQWVRRGTRFDAELKGPLQFGSTTVNPANLSLLGLQPPPDTVVHARLTRTLDSGTATLGEPVEAFVSTPLFSPDGKLILPTGTLLKGKVTSVAAARWFHRGGRLRFNFETVEIPAEMNRLVPQTRPAESKTLAALAGAEHSGKSEIRVDGEGSVKAVESKTRFLAPAIALIVAQRGMDNDADRTSATGTAAGSNAGGRALGGISGFGMFGGLLAQTSPGMSTALGLYGVAWSVYSTVIARGSEVEFQQNAALDIRFGGHRPPTSGAATKFAMGN